jgi:hypothetical protein
MGPFEEAWARKSSYRVAMRSLSTLACIATLLLACSGSSGPKHTEGPDTDPSGTPTSDAMATESPEEKFARQTADTVDKMCQRLIDCSIEDAKKNMSPEELEKLDVPKIKPVAIGKCREEYGTSPLSPRQVIGIRTCLGQATDCSTFNDCIGSAGKGPEETP